MTVTKSAQNNLTTPNGNSLALFVDITDNILKIKDINGNIQPLSDYISGGGGGVTSVGITSSSLTVTNSPITTSGDIDVEIPDGFLKVQNGVPLDATLRTITDQNNNASTLKLSTLLAQIVSTLKITTDEEIYLDIEDGSTNNRFTISRPSVGQKVALDFASNPTGSTTLVGSIRTFKDGVTLTDAITFREDGRISFEANEIINFVPVQNAGGALAITSANYALYNGTVYNVTGAVTISVDNTVPDGFNMTIIQQDANQCVIAAGAGLTLRNNDNHTSSAGQWAVIKIIRSGANLLLSGDTAVNPALFGTAYMFVELLVDNDSTSSPPFLIATDLQNTYGNASFFGFYLAGGLFDNIEVVNYTKLDWGTTYPAVVEIPVPPQSGGTDSLGVGLVQYLMESLLIAQGTYTQGIFSFLIPTGDTGNLTMQNMYINDSIVLGDCSQSINPSFDCVGAYTNSILTVTSADVTAGAKIPAGTYRIYNDYQLGGGALNFEKNNATQAVYFRGQNIF
jgi:hypothetical protein